MRVLVSGLVLVVAMAALPFYNSAAQSNVSPPGTPPPAAPLAAGYDLPLIDAHDHLQARARAEDLVLLMNAAGIERMVLMAQVGDEHGSDDQSLMFAQRYPGRFIPFVAFQVPLLSSLGPGARERWMSPDSAALSFLYQTEDKLRSGNFWGLGEIIVRHYAYRTSFGAVASDIDIPADAPLMHQVAQLAAKYRVPMLIHAEGEPRVAAAMDRLLMAHEDVRIIWAHNCGRQSADRITQLLEHHSNLFCDLAGMTNDGGYGSGWPRREPWTALIEDGTGQLFPGMKDLFEAFPDRFLGVGADVAHYGAWPRYLPTMIRFRRLLAGLSPATARKLAHDNAEHVLARPPRAASLAK